MNNFKNFFKMIAYMIGATFIALALYFLFAWVFG